MNFILIIGLVTLSYLVFIYFWENIFSYFSKKSKRLKSKRALNKLKDQTIALVRTKKKLGI